MGWHKSEPDPVYPSPKPTVKVKSEPIKMSESEAYVILSEVRRGHKRELEFALQSLTEFAASSLDQIRSRDRVVRYSGDDIELSKPKEGYFRALFSCIERLLISLKVKNLIISSARKAESMWTPKLGFVKVASKELKSFAEDVKPMVFEGTTVLHKHLPNCI